MSLAPLIASSTVSTPFSAFTYFSADLLGLNLLSCKSISIASGSRPFSLAIDALVFLLGLNGL